MSHRQCIAGLLFAGPLLAASAPATAAVTLVGPPTYATSVSLVVARGGTPPFAAGTTDHRHRSAGERTSTIGVAPLYWNGGPPSFAEAEANDFNLRATARSQGGLLSDLVNTPHVTAEAHGETTRFFHFDSDWAVTGIPLLLSGQLGGHFAYYELPVSNYARIQYSMTLTDAAGAALASVFSIGAEVRHLGSGSFGTLLSSSGGADAALWEAAFTPTTLPHSSPGTQQAWNIAYIDLVDSALVASAGGLYGFRWTLDAETLLEGNAIGGQFVADFGHTADIGLGRSEAELAALGITEVLTVPVPEPSAAWLALAGIAALGWRVRHARSFA